jgi:hypothetical protein
VRIHLAEHRETTGEDLPKTVHELELHLTGLLTRDGAPKENGDVLARLVFEHVRLSFGSPGEPGAMLTFDSALNKAGRGDALADIMVHVARAEVVLRIDARGRLVELRGLDPLWRKANLLLVPPALLTAQWMFRDAGMAEVVAEALFPPMPTRPVKPRDTWQFTMPVNIPLMARLTSNLTGRLEEVRPEGQAVLTLVTSPGTIEPSPELIDGHPPGLQPVIESAEHSVGISVDPRGLSYRQASERKLELLLSLTPPVTSASRQMRVKQVRRLDAEREASAPARPAQ